MTDSTPEQHPEPEKTWASPVSEGNPLLDALIVSNGERLERLQQQGFQVDVTRLMLITFIQFTCPVGSQERVDLEMAFQQQLASTATQIEEQVDRIKLQEGAQSGLIVPTQG